MTTFNLKDAMDAIEVYNTTIATLNRQISSAELEREKLVQLIQKNIETSSFEHEGRWYMIRSYKDGSLSFVKMNQKPGSWLRGKGRKRTKIVPEILVPFVESGESSSEISM